MKQKFLLFGVSIGLLLGVAACTEDIDFKGVLNGIDASTSLVVPIGTAEATIEQVLNAVNTTEVLKDEENNTCYMHFEDSMVIDDDLARLERGGTVDTTYYVKDDPNHPEFGTPLHEEFNLSQVLSYNFDYDEQGLGGQTEQRVDSILITSAQIVGSYVIVGVTTWGNSSITGTISFPNIKELADLKIPISFSQSTGEINYEITTPFFVKFAPTNNLAVMKIELKGSADGMVINEDAKVNATTRFEVVNFSKAWGFFGKDDKVTEDNKMVAIPTDLFKKTVFGRNNLRFNNPLITFKFRNKFGVPLRFEVEEISAIGENGEEKEASFNGQKNTVMYLDPAPNGTSVAENSFTYDRENGGTHQLFQIRPQYFKYKFNVKVWRKEGVEKHFWFKPSDMKVDMTVKMPFVFDPESQFIHHDTIYADLRKELGKDTLPNGVIINKLKIAFDYTNGLPCQAKTKAELLDESGKVIFTKEIMMKAGKTNAEGLVTAPTVDQFTLEFTGADVPVIMNTKNLVLTSQLNAESDDKMMHFRLNDALKIKIYVFAQGGVEDLDKFIK